jgi:hypothetical protein
MSIYVVAVSLIAQVPSYLALKKVLAGRLHAAPSEQAANPRSGAWTHCRRARLEIY